MKKFMIKIENDMCKNDEIAILDKLEQEYSRCPDNYLYDFFCGQNVQWLRNKIQDDIFPALPYKMEARIVNQDIEIKNLREELRVRKNQIDQYLQIENLKDQIENTKSSLFERDKELSREKMAHHHTENKLDQMIEINEEIGRLKLEKIQNVVRTNNLEDRLKRASEQIKIAAEYCRAI